jgi:hypothetical protein
MENDTSLALIDRAVQRGDIAEASRLVKLAIKQKIDLKGRNIFYANILLASMPWNEFSALPKRNRSSKKPKNVPNRAQVSAIHSCPLRYNIHFTAFQSPIRPQSKAGSSIHVG